MDDSIKYIEHSGIVESIERNYLHVRFTQYSACAICHAKGACSISDMDIKEVRVATKSNHFLKGDTVTILLSRKMGYKALFFAYLFPLILMSVVILYFSAHDYSESIIGFSGLLTIIIYYFVLYIFKNKLNNQFVFSIKE